MQQIFIVKENHPKLILFFTGWGMDEHPFLNAEVTNVDYMVCYDYSTFDFDQNLLKDYEEIIVVAWSLGVWSAHYVLQNHQLPIVCSIAVNGTIYPIDDEKGIPKSTFWATARQLDEANLAQFHEKICLRPFTLSYFQKQKPGRSLEDVKSELNLFGKQYYEIVEKGDFDPDLFHWDDVIIGVDDLIFPTTHQYNCWEKHTKNLISLNAPHFVSMLIPIAYETYTIQSKKGRVESEDIQDYIIQKIRENLHES